MTNLTSTIERVASRAVERWLDDRIPALFNEIIRKESARTVQLSGPLPPVQFVWQMAMEFMRFDLTMKATDARDLAVSTLRDFLRGEKVKFGHRDYAWDQQAAFTLARECEIAYWEAES